MTRFLVQSPFVCIRRDGHFEKIIHVDTSIADWNLILKNLLKKTHCRNIDHTLIYCRRDGTTEQEISRILSAETGTVVLKAWH